MDILFSFTPHFQSTNQPINQSTNQPINQSTNQPIKVSLNTTPYFFNSSNTGSYISLQIGM